MPRKATSVRFIVQENLWDYSDVGFLITALDSINTIKDQILQDNECLILEYKKALPSYW